MSKKITVAATLVKTLAAEGKTKSEILASLVETLSITKANAYVYYSKVAKASEGLTVAAAAPKVPKVKAPKEAKKPFKRNPITLTPKAKVMEKLAEIDKALYELRTKGPATPFHGLGV